MPTYFRSPRTRRIVEYEDMQIEKWQIHIDSKLYHQQKILWQGVEAELKRQLQGIARVVGNAPLAIIRNVPIWIHTDAPENIGLAYHPSAEFLRQHDLNPNMAHGVEIGRAANFVPWSCDQPWCVMHEFAHAYYDLATDKRIDAQIKTAYQSAMAAKRYESVLYGDGRVGRAYATTNPQEYFAESTEAYFGTNDAYPFVRAELQQADPDGFKLMQAVWGAPMRRNPGS